MTKHVNTPFKTLLEEFIMTKEKTFVDPVRVLRMKGQAVPYSKGKQIACLLSIMTTPLKEIAKRSYTSSEVVAKWRCEDEFNVIRDMHAKEFVDDFLAPFLLCENQDMRKIEDYKVYGLPIVKALFQWADSTEDPSIAQTVLLLFGSQKAAAEVLNYSLILKIQRGREIIRKQKISATEKDELSITLSMLESYLNLLHSKPSKEKKEKLYLWQN